VWDFARISASPPNGRKHRPQYCSVSDSSYSVCPLSDLIIEKFNEILKSFIAKMEVNIYQIQTLTKTRDELLPKLMNGQLRVKG
jgi:hypothetical protein